MPLNRTQRIILRTLAFLIAGAPMLVPGYGAQWSATLSPNDWHPVADAGDLSAMPPGHVFSVPTAANTQRFMRLTVIFQ